MSKVIMSNVRGLLIFNFRLFTKFVLYNILYYSTFKFVSQYVNELVVFQPCGEYRSRTDDLLRARQAL